MVDRWFSTIPSFEASHAIASRTETPVKRISQLSRKSSCKELLYTRKEKKVIEFRGEKKKEGNRGDEHSVGEEVDEGHGDVEPEDGGEVVEVLVEEGLAAVEH